MTALALLACAGSLRAEVRDAGFAARVAVEVSADTVTVGERFDVTYQVTYADSLSFVEPMQINPGTCRVVDSSWEPAGGKVAGGTDTRGLEGRVRFIPVSIDSVHVPGQAFDFVAPAGDTLRAFSDPVDLSLNYLSVGSAGMRPLKEQWSMPPNWLLWITLGVAALVLAAAVVWWIRRRRARRAVDEVPEVRLPPDFVALTELERIEAMGLPARGEFKQFYTLVTDTVRRYVEARFGVMALDRTTGELLGDLAHRRLDVDGLAALLNEADLVKFAKYTPDVTRADAALGRARDVVVSTTPRVASDAPGRDAPEQGVAG
jgi:uncharacterized protein YjiS (DUF1127 family)